MENKEDFNQVFFLKNRRSGLTAMVHKGASPEFIEQVRDTMRFALAPPPPGFGLDYLKELFQIAEPAQQPTRFFAPNWHAGVQSKSEDDTRAYIGEGIAAYIGRMPEPRYDFNRTITVADIEQWCKPPTPAVLAMRRAEYHDRLMQIPGMREAVEREYQSYLAKQKNGKA